MRRVVYAATFVDEADAVAAHIESLFGLRRADQFRNDLERFCEALSDTPGRGKPDHGYRTPLLGVVFERNWIFFRLEEETAYFVQLSNRVDSRLRSDFEPHLGNPFDTIEDTFDKSSNTALFLNR